MFCGISKGARAKITNPAAVSTGIIRTVRTRGKRWEKKENSRSTLSCVQKLMSTSSPSIV